MKKLSSLIMLAIMLICVSACGINGEETDGYKIYRGDSHTHSIWSDGKGTIEENFAAGIAMGLDFVYATDHNTADHRIDVELFDGADYDKEGFLGIVGCEVTPFKNHMLAYDIGDDNDSLWTRMFTFSENQERIDEVNKMNDGDTFVYIAHPMLEPWEWTTPETDPQNIVGLEVWNGFDKGTGEANQQAMAWWDQLNNTGYHLYGNGNSDAHNPGSVGIPTTCMYLKNLSEKEVNRAYREGTYYVTDGPILSFSIDGKMMGRDIDVASKGKVVQIKFSAEYSFGIEYISIIKNGENLKTVLGEDYESGEEIILNDKAMQGDFYRMIVVGTSGEFAFSNPIFII